MNDKLKYILFWTASGLATLFFCLLTILTFSEWWAVAINRDVDAYPWGRINGNPWYYHNPGTYSIVMLIEGTVLLAAVAVTIWFLTHGRKTKAFYSLLTCFGLFVAMVLNEDIQ